MKKTIAALNAFVAPVQVLLRRGGEQAEKAGRVRAEAVDEIVGVHDVALRLAHLRAVLYHHALGEEVFERLPGAHESKLVEDPVEEPGVEEMEDGVLHAADILVHGQSSNLP